MWRGLFSGTMGETGPRSQGDELPDVAPHQEAWVCDFDPPPSF